MYRWSAALLPEWLRLLSGGTGTEQWASTFGLIRSDLSQRLTGCLPITAIVRLKTASKRLPSCETDTTTSDHPEGRRLASWRDPPLHPPLRVTFFSCYRDVVSITAILATVYHPHTSLANSLQFHPQCIVYEVKRLPWSFHRYLRDDLFLEPTAPVRLRLRAHHKPEYTNLVLCSSLVPEPTLKIFGDRHLHIASKFRSPTTRGSWVAICG